MGITEKTVPRSLGGSYQTDAAVDDKKLVSCKVKVKDCSFIHTAYTVWLTYLTFI